jgi:hypothetical protein
VLRIPAITEYPPRISAFVLVVSVSPHSLTVHR